MPPIKQLPVAAAGAVGRLAVRIVRLALGATLVLGLLIVLDALFLPDDDTGPPA